MTIIVRNRNPLRCLLVLFCLFGVGLGWGGPVYRRTVSATKARWMLLFSHFSDECEEEDDPDDSEEDKPLQKAYGRRSMAWTNKYRKLFPYEYARKQAMNLGLRSKEEWDDYLADGKVYHGPYLPSRPDEMYADEWVSWPEFLGIMRTYEETRHIVQHVLQLKSLEEYTQFVEADVKRAEGLRIPYKPHLVYRDKGWVSDKHFFGK